MYIGLSNQSIHYSLQSSLLSWYQSDVEVALAESAKGGKARGAAAKGAPPPGTSRTAARGCAVTPGDPAGAKKKCDGAGGAITRSVESKNSKSCGAGREESSEKGKDASSKTTCQEMIIRLEDRSRQQ